jgi:hypothetical protein
MTDTRAGPDYDLLNPLEVFNAINIANSGGFEEQSQSPRRGAHNAHGHLKLLNGVKKDRMDDMID